MRTAARLALVAGLAALLPLSALAYDDTWYEADFWGGEYPNGFSVSEAATLPMRGEPDFDAAATLECPLAKNAVYHPWNHDRVEADLLVFKSFSRKQDFTVETPSRITVFTEYDWEEVNLDLKSGNTWTYLTYLGEGYFLLEFGGKSYIGEQTLFEISSASDEPETHEWLRLICGNGETGWLLLDEVKASPAIGEPNIIGYGEAADLGSDS